MSYNPSFLSTNNFGEDLIITNLENNMKLFLDWGFLNIGAYQNVNIPTTNLHNFNLHILKPKKDVTQQSYRSWITPKKDWVHESGVCFKDNQPLAFSGVYVNNSFYPAPTGNSTLGYRVDYPNGQIVFNSSVSPTSLVQANYSYKVVQVYKSNAFPQWKEIQLESSLNSFNQFKKYDSGDFAIDPEHRVQLPSVIIEVDSRSSAKPFRLGDRSLIISQDILLHVISENKHDRNSILDILRLQKDRYVWLFDTNKVVADKKYELNFDGSINTSGSNYYNLVNNPNYRWKLSRITDVSFSDITFYHMNLFGSTVRISQEIIHEDFSATCFVEPETSSGFSGSESISFSLSGSSSSGSSSSSISESVSATSESVSGTSQSGTSESVSATSESVSATSESVSATSESVSATSESGTSESVSATSESVSATSQSGTSESISDTSASAPSESSESATSESISMTSESGTSSSATSSSATSSSESCIECLTSLDCPVDKPVCGEDGCCREEIFCDYLCYYWYCDGAEPTCKPILLGCPAYDDPCIQAGNCCELAGFFSGCGEPQIICESSSGSISETISGTSGSATSESISASVSATSETSGSATSESVSATSESGTSESSSATSESSSATSESSSASSSATSESSSATSESSSASSSATSESFTSETSGSSTESSSSSETESLSSSISSSIGSSSGSSSSTIESSETSEAPLCNVVGCPGANEEALFIDCGLVDPNCYFNCDICDCICESSSESFTISISETSGSSSTGSSGSSTGSSGSSDSSSGSTSSSESDGLSCCNLEGFSVPAGVPGCWWATAVYSQVGDSNCYSASVSKCGESMSATICCDPTCTDYTDCGCYSWVADYSCGVEDPSKDIRNPCGCNDPGFLIVGTSSTLPNCRTCCGCDGSTCVAWGGSLSCPCPSSEAVCRCDYVCGSPCWNCSGGECIPVTCPPTTCFQEDGCYNDEFTCNDFCGPTNEQAKADYCCDPPPVALSYNCALKQEWSCVFVPETQDEEEQCVCTITSEAYVPCSECINSPPPEEGDCGGFTYCQYYECIEGCSEFSAGSCNGPAKIT